MTGVLGHTKKTEWVDLFSDFIFAFLANIKKHEREDEGFPFSFSGARIVLQYCLVSEDRQGRKSRGEIKDLAIGCLFSFIISPKFSLADVKLLHTSLDLDLMKRRLFILYFMSLIWKVATILRLMSFSTLSKKRSYICTCRFSAVVSFLLCSPYILAICVPSFHTFRLSHT